jgi:hypothetical protein
VQNFMTTTFALPQLALPENVVFASRRLAMRNVTPAVAELARLWAQKISRLLPFVALTARAWLTPQESRPLPMRYGRKVSVR